jgi:hypothetical protein
MGDALDSGVHLTILRTKSRKPFLFKPSRFFSESSQDTDGTGFRHFQLPDDIKSANAYSWDQAHTSIIKVHRAELASLEELERRRSQETDYTREMEAVPILASLGVKHVKQASVLNHVPDLAKALVSVLVAIQITFRKMVSHHDSDIPDIHGVAPRHL